MPDLDFNMLPPPNDPRMIFVFSIIAYAIINYGLYNIWSQAYGY